MIFSYKEFYEKLDAIQNGKFITSIEELNQILLKINSMWSERQYYEYKELEDAKYKALVHNLLASLFIESATIDIANIKEYIDETELSEVTIELLGPNILQLKVINATSNSMVYAVYQQFQSFAYAYKQLFGISLAQDILDRGDIYIEPDILTIMCTLLHDTSPTQCMAGELTSVL